ncbi:MAG: hypothetical protein JO129_00595 [Candidatus Dependentiae bacterium]|nr:hypothetical protein [Candidatus Dependentiae bacterium]
MKYLSYVMAILFLPSILLYSSASNYDTSFNPAGTGSGIPGIAVLPLGLSHDTQAQALAIQSDGKIVITGYDSTTNDLSDEIFVARYLANGTLDTSFNASGTPGYAIFSTFSCKAYGVAVDAFGNIIVAGVNVATNKMLVIRYTSAGILDASFNASGTPGYALLTISSGITSSIGFGVIIQPNNNIVITGCLGTVGAPYQGIVLACFLGSGVNAGTVNPSFGTTGTGYTIFNSGTYSSGNAIKLQSTGNIIVTGFVQAGGTQLAILRFSSTGQLDTTFGTNAGYSTLNLSGGSAGTSLAITYDAIIVAGNTGSNNGILVASFTSNGQINTEFNANGTAGYVLSTISGNYGGAPITSYSTYGNAIQADGKIVVCGAVGFQPVDFALYGFLIRYNPNGSIDTTFTPSGSIVYAAGGGTENYAVAIQPDQKIVTTGFIAETYFVPAIIRLLGVTASEPINAEIGTYGYNSNFISEFLYVDFYATEITDPIAQAVAIAQVNGVIATYASTYAAQPNFNYLSYLYLMDKNLGIAQANLLTLYPTSTDQINKFFIYLQERINSLNGIN